MKYRVPLIPSHHVEDGMLALYQDERGPHIIFADLVPGQGTFELPQVEGQQLVGIYELIPLSPIIEDDEQG